MNSCRLGAHRIASNIRHGPTAWPRRSIYSQTQGLSTVLCGEHASVFAPRQAVFPFLSTFFTQSAILLSQAEEFSSKSSHDSLFSKLVERILSLTKKVGFIEKERGFMARESPTLVSSQPHIDPLISTIHGSLRRSLQAETSTDRRALDATDSHIGYSRSCSHRLDTLR